tara:strand:- start:2849 stop:4015 length:1167 start_codon:yes stop_codon:yes gene_type:complete
MKNKFEVSVVGGAGHIGLPLSLFISSFGHDVTIIDTNKKVLEGLRGGNLPFYEEGLDKYLKKAQKNNIKLSNNNQDLSKSDFVIITLGSSSEAKDIDLFKKVMDDVIKNIKQESNIILRSTTDIGSIEEIRSNPEFIEKNINLAYCPERIAEGMSLIELPQIPQIIGINDENDFLIFQNFFNTLNIESIKTTYRNAVFIKLFTNTYRYSEFSIVNEFFNIAQNNSIDFDEIIKIAKKDYPRLKNMPSKGFVGGPCLIKDSKTFYENYAKDNILLSAIQNINTDFFKSILDTCNKLFEEKIVIQLGITFKPNSDDLRSSLSYEFNNYLRENGFKVYVVDEYVNQEDTDIEIFKYEDVKDKTNNLLISTYHDYFKNLDLNNKKVVVVGYK